MFQAQDSTGKVLKLSQKVDLKELLEARLTAALAESKPQPTAKPSVTIDCALDTTNETCYTCSDEATAGLCAEAPVGGTLGLRDSLFLHVRDVVAGGKGDRLYLLLVHSFSMACIC
jgi:hypothetical protein